MDTQSPGCTASMVGGMAAWLDAVKSFSKGFWTV